MRWAIPEVNHSTRPLLTIRCSKSKMPWRWSNPTSSFVGFAIEFTIRFWKGPCRYWPWRGASRCGRLVKGYIDWLCVVCWSSDRLQYFRCWGHSVDNFRKQPEINQTSILAIQLGQQFVQAWPFNKHTQTNHSLHSKGSMPVS